MQTSKEFNADAYHAMLASILPAGRSRTLPGVDDASTASSGSESRSKVGAGAGPSVTNPTGDHAGESHGEEDERYSETILKLPEEGAAAEASSGDRVQEPDGNPGIRLSDEGNDGDTILRMSPHPGQDIRGAGEASGVSGDEGPTSLNMSRRPRFRVTRIRDGCWVDCSQDTATIGRSAQADIHMGGNMNVSRIHAQISRLPGGGFEITDRHSSNGTRVSGRLLAPGETAPVGPSGTFSLADSDFMIEELDREGTTGTWSGSSSSGLGGGV